MIDSKINRLIICYAVYQPLYSEWSECASTVIFHRGLPSEKEILEGNIMSKSEKSLMVIDDLGTMIQKKEDKYVIFLLNFL